MPAGVSVSGNMTSACYTDPAAADCKAFQRTDVGAACWAQRRRTGHCSLRLARDRTCPAAANAAPHLL